jgi:hypothetical protein
MTPRWVLPIRSLQPPLKHPNAFLSCPEETSSDMDAHEPKQLISKKKKKKKRQIQMRRGNHNTQQKKKKRLNPIPPSTQNQPMHSTPSLPMPFPSHRSFFPTMVTN